jgi:hypothetical protein
VEDRPLHQTLAQELTTTNVSKITRRNKTPATKLLLLNASEA